MVELEASTIHTPGVLSPSRIAIGPRLLRLRSDEQLVALFRSGHDEAFQVIYDRYHKRLAGYARQMLPRGHDPDDVLQDVFVRAYRALRHDDRELAVRPWLFRVAHNCCIDELRRTVPVPTDELSTDPSPMDDPAARVDARENLRRLIEDIGRLPEQQRSALLLRELSGISYEEVATVLGTTVPAVKSLLVRARTGLVRAGEARDTACSEIREQIALAHDQGVRATPIVRRHLRDCPTCRSYRGQMRVVDRRMAALLPAGPLATLARLVGLPGGTGGTAALGASGTASGGAALGANHVAALVAAAIASAGGAVGLQHVIASAGRSAPTVHRSHHGRSHGGPAGSSSAATAALDSAYQDQTSAGAATSSVSDQDSVSGTGAGGGAGNSGVSAGTGTAGGGTQPAVSPTPTAPPGWVSTGPPPTARPTTGDTGPTPTSTGGDGSTGSPTPTTDGTGSTTTTGDSSGATGSTPTGATGPTSTTDTGTSSTSDPGATTATAGDGSTGTSSSTSSSGTGS